MCPCTHVGEDLVGPLVHDRPPKFAMFFRLNASNTFRTIEPYRPLSEISTQGTLSEGTPTLNSQPFQQAIPDVKIWELGRAKAEKLRHQFRAVACFFGPHLQPNQ